MRANPKSGIIRILQLHCKFVHAVTYLRNVGNEHDNETVNEGEQRRHTRGNTNDEEDNSHDNCHTRDDEHEALDFYDECRLTGVTQQTAQLALLVHAALLGGKTGNFTDQSVISSLHR